MKLFLVSIIIILLYLPYTVAIDAKVTITPDQYKLIYNGERKEFNFKVCHDKNSFLSIPLVTEITTENLADIQNIKIQSPLNAKTSNCRNVNVILNANNQYNSTEIILKLKYYDRNKIENIEDIPINTSNTASNILKVQDETNLTIVELNESQDDSSFGDQFQANMKDLINFVKKFWIVIIIILIIFGSTLWYYIKKQEKEEEDLVISKDF